MSIFTNCLILRDEGFLSTEIKVNVGGDGSCQWTQGALKTLLMRCPASIPDKEIQVEIIECLHSALQLYEENAADPIAILQAKAKNNYFLKRAIVRHTLRGTEETISP
jgi:hypothetical protein